MFLLKGWCQPTSEASFPPGGKALSQTVAGDAFRGRYNKKTEKKLTNVSLYVCMSAGNCEMLVFLSVFFPQQCTFFKFFNGCFGKKKQKNVSFYGVCMYVRPKLTFVIFYLFFLHLLLTFFCFFSQATIKKLEKCALLKKNRNKN